LSAALAANLALKKSWQEALINSKAFVYGALLENVTLSSTLNQMYPPVKNYTEEITLEEL
jgi:hydroxymethylpyrimidine/phosphomethylpyrimidine kinase